MKKEINKRINQIEIEEGVKIFYVCESGSRAWGFPSTNSDYDVRFLYLHPKDWYLSIDMDRKRDVIERPIDDDLDINGWDLTKALNLLRKGNPPLMEWLGSPIIYMEKSTIAAAMRRLTAEYYSPLTSMFHYLHMTRGNYRDYLLGEEVWIKKYFYVLRPLLAILWIEKDLGVVPTEFQVLVDKVVDSPNLKKEIEKLVAAKRDGQELDRGPRIAPISDFIEGELSRLENEIFKQKYDKLLGPIEVYNQLFRSALDQVWSEKTK